MEWILALITGQSHCFSALLCPAPMELQNKWFWIDTNPLTAAWSIDLIVSCKRATVVWRCWPEDTRRQVLFMGWFYGNWTPREHPINQVYSKIYFSCSPMAHSFCHTYYFPSAYVLPLFEHYFLLDQRAHDLKPSNCSRWPCCINILRFISGLLWSFVFMQLAGSGSIWVKGVTTLWSLWDLTWAQVILTVKHVVGPGLIMSLCCQGDCLFWHLRLTQSHPASIGGGSWLFRASPGIDRCTTCNVPRLLSNRVACSFSTAAPTPASSNTPPSIINPAN